MVCIYCGHDTQVTNSRLQKKNNNVWRRRSCISCGSLFTTLEKADFMTALSVSSQKVYKPFSRDKLLLSIYDSLKHRKSALTDATALTDTVISKLLRHIKDGRVDRNKIVEISLKTLKQFDKPAAIYYKAYHPLADDRS